MAGKVSAALKLASLSAVAIMSIGMQSRVGGLDERLLAGHNRERDAMAVGKLSWNAGLAQGAQQWADYLAATGRFEHSPNRPGKPFEGENIWGGTGGAFTPESMVGLWIDEKKNFKPGVFPANSKTGDVRDVSHYTQLVWHETGEVGCGLARGEREEILVCRYSRPGNVIGRNPL